MHIIALIGKNTWRSLLVGLGYVVGHMLAGMLGGMAGGQMMSSTRDFSAWAWLLISGIVLGVVLGPFAARLTLPRLQHSILWGSLILFNLGSVTIEGAYFVPERVPVPLPALFFQQLLASAGAALGIVLLFAAVGRPGSSWSHAIRRHPWHSWLWRFLLSAFSYLVFYFIFGWANYSLVTAPYYETHAGGLTVPAPLIVLSIWFFLLSVSGTRRQLMVRTGWLLFAIGGVSPLVSQVNSLPSLLLAASGVEIFLQNFFTGLVAARLMGMEAETAPRTEPS